MDAAEDTQENGLSAGRVALVFVAALALLFSRRPGDLFHAQFYAEDGARFYRDAYMTGALHSFWVPYASYLHALPRLVAALSLLLPLRWAPLLMNVVGAAVQALPAAALLSRRAATWGPLGLRGVLAACYLADPNAFEIHVVLSNAQWHLGLLMLILAFSAPPRGWALRAAEICIFLVGAFSGPFGVALLPLVLVWWWFSRARWTLAQAGVLALGAIGQVHAYLTSTRMPDLPLGATLDRFLRLVGGGVFLNSMLGQSAQTMRLPEALLAVVFLFGVGVIVCACWRGPLAYRLYVVYTVLLFAMALRSPAIFFPLPRWYALLSDPGMRYDVLPTLAFLWGAAYCAWLTPVRALRWAGAGVLALAVLGGLRKWEYERRSDYSFPAFAARFEAMQPGEALDIPIYPDQWHVPLVKH